VCGSETEEAVVGLARFKQYPFLFIQRFSNLFEFEMVKDGLLVLEKFQTKYRIVGNYIRNNFSHWNFSKFRMEFELKNREHI
jgi:hypothetical protein